MESNDFAFTQPRQYGEAVNDDRGLAKLAQAQSDEEAMAIESTLLVETNFPPEEDEESDS